MQHKGDPEVFVKHLEITLALARTLENASPRVSANLARSVEGKTIMSLDHWLVALSGRQDLLRRVSVALGRNRSALEGSDREHDFAEYLIALNSLDNPSPWLQSRLMGGDMPRNQLSEVPVVAAVWQLSWERERQERLLRRQFFSSTPLESPEASLLPSNFSTISKSDENLLHHRTTLEAARLRVALRHHQATTGKPATDLRQLIPASIDAIPLDPYDGKPFRYRLSSGEDSVEGLRERDSEGNSVERKRTIPAGQGILWSVGRDGLDGGGKVNDLDKGDRIFLVPLERKK